MKTRYVVALVYSAFALGVLLIKAVLVGSETPGSIFENLSPRLFSAVLAGLTWSVVGLWIGIAVEAIRSKRS